MSELREFLNSPALAPIVGVIVLSVADWALGTYAAWADGKFKWEEVGRFLRTTVLDRVFPLAVLGGAAYLAPTTEVVAGVSVQAALTALYVGSAGLAVVGMLAGLKDKWGTARAAR